MSKTCERLAKIFRQKRQAEEDSQPATPQVKRKCVSQDDVLDMRDRDQELQQSTSMSRTSRYEQLAAEYNICRATVSKKLSFNEEDPNRSVSRPIGRPRLLREEEMAVITAAQEWIHRHKCPPTLASNREVVRALLK
jgi:hypothetical protein